MGESGERGPRYHIWTLRLPSQGGLRILTQFGFSAAHARSSAMRDVQCRRFFISHLHRDDRLHHMVVSHDGQLSIWDAVAKQHMWSAALDVSRVHAVGSWLRPTQYMIVATSPTNGVRVHVFDYQTPIFSLDLEQVQGVDQLSSMSAGRRVVHSVHYLFKNSVLLLLQEPDLDLEPVGLVVDLLAATSHTVDVYGEGPPKPELDSFMAENDEAPYALRSEVKSRTPSRRETPVFLGVDKIVACHVLDQAFAEESGRKLRVAVLVYSSNRICHLLCGSTWKLYEQLLIKDTGVPRYRKELPIAIAALDAPSSDGHHLLISYGSLMLRWWQLSLSNNKLIAFLTLGCPLTHLSAIDWSAQEAALRRPTTARETSAGSPDAAKHKACRAAPTPPGSPPRPPPSPRSPAAKEQRKTRAGESHMLKSVGFSSIGPLALKKTRTRLDCVEDAAPARVALLVVASESGGGMPMFLATGNKITKVYTFLDHLLERNKRVEQIWCQGKNIVALLNNGDVRQIDFLLDDDPLTLVEMSLESSTS